MSTRESTNGIWANGSTREREFQREREKTSRRKLKSPERSTPKQQQSTSKQQPAPESQETTRKEEEVFTKDNFSLHGKQLKCIVGLTKTPGDLHFLRKFTDDTARLILAKEVNSSETLQKRVLAARLSSLIPFEPRYFLPSQRVLARLVVDDDHLPIAIQRCLTEFGTAHDCHIRTDKAIRSFCAVLADYHSDIIREYHSDQFFLSTLATETVIVDDGVVRRPRLIELEAAEQTRTKCKDLVIGVVSKSCFFSEQKGLPSGMKCRCQKYSDQLLSHQENTGVIVTTGIVKLNDGAQLRIGCSTFTFHRN
ncbi:unnamed protein product [Caenorhabditis nigoni]